MAEQQQATARQHVAQQDWRRIGENLSKALSAIGADMRALAEQQQKAREVAALFELHRQYRFRPDGAPPRDETKRRMGAAMDGYDPAYLEELAMFGGFLADAAGKRYAAR